MSRVSGLYLGLPLEESMGASLNDTVPTVEFSLKKSDTEQFGVNLTLYMLVSNKIKQDQDTDHQQSTVDHG